MNKSESPPDLVRLHQRLQATEARNRHLENESDRLRRELKAARELARRLETQRDNLATRRIMEVCKWQGKIGATLSGAASR
ncbi:hypothetical protein LJC36_00095 [Desulfovibrio sp. OttesenSCG-928-C14]|nr:hypothetical protein [Desulfovibrio sp. OttesenSCG-928-C14]